MLRALVFAPYFVSSFAFAEADAYAHVGALRGNGDTTWSAGLGFISKRSEHIGIGFGHFNEGHLPDNHRDGFFAQGWYLQPIGTDFELQVGAGPYASMNNTTVDGGRKNDFNMGLLTSAALKWRPWASPLYLRLQYNHVFMTSTYDTNSVLLGVGRDFDSKESGLGNGMRPTHLGLWGGYSRTTQVGTQDSAIAFELEAKFPIDSSDHLAYSVSFLWEGDTILQDRKGIPIRLWYDKQATDRLTFSFGLGPYPAYNSAGDGGFQMNGIISVRATYLVQPYDIGFMYTRVASFSHRDQDMLMLGFLMRL